MKRIWILFFLTWLLCGCDAGENGITNVSSPTSPSETLASTGTSGLYVADSLMERQTNRAVTVFPLPMEDAYGIRAMGQSILVFSGKENTTITCLTGSNLAVDCAITLDGFLSPEDPSIHIREDTFVCCDPGTGETLVLDAQLQIIHRIPKPRGMVGTPILTRDNSTLYYCTARGVYAWDLEAGLHRTVKEMAYPRQTLAGTAMDGRILQCSILDGSQEKTLFLSTDTGKIQGLYPGNIRLSEKSSFYYACLCSGISQTMVFGQPGSQLMALTPKDISGLFTFLEQQHSAVGVCVPSDGVASLDYYDLTSGMRVSTLQLNEAQYPISIEDCTDGFVYLLCFDPEFGCESIYRWNPKSVSCRDSLVYTGYHYTADKPDVEGLAQCQAYAEELSAKYGIRICIWKDAVAVQPWDFFLEAEYQAGIFMQQLKKLDGCLSQYPKSMLTDTASHFSSLTICLVRSITGTAASGSTDPAAGVQFLDGTDAYIAIAAGEFSDSSLYHELFHVMETHIYGNSIAFDQWDSLNPAGFCYDYSYLSNKTRDSGVYLHHSNRAFVDTYSMSFPKEDRARIMEYAMLPGHGELFQSQTLQRKLRAICHGIREAYGLENSEEAFLWEQYLA